MTTANVVYKLSEISDFNKLIFDNTNFNNSSLVTATDAKTKSNSETNIDQKMNTDVLKLCKTTIITQNNQQYKIIRYDKNFLSIDLVPTLGLLRSVIVNKNNKVVSFSPPKSIAWESFIKANPLKTDSIIAEEFVEGTMINVFWDATSGLSGAWKIATRNSVGGEVSFYKSFTNDATAAATISSNTINKTFRTMFLEALKCCNFDLNLLNINYCYSFVLQHPENRIVLPVKTPQLYMVKAYEICNTESGVINVYPMNMENVKKEGLWYQTSIRFPETYTWTDYDELKARYASMNTDYKIMGVVLYDTFTGTRTKLRNPVYENVRELRGKQPKLQYQYLCLRHTGTVSDFLKYYPEHKKDFLFFRKCLHEFTDALFTNYVACYIKKVKPLSEFPKNFRTHMFNLHKKFIDELKPQNLFITTTVVIKYVNDMSPSLQMYSLNYNMRKRMVDSSKLELDT